MTNCKFGGDFALELIEVLQKNPSLTNLEFQNKPNKRTVQDTLSSMPSKLSQHIRSLTLDSILSKEGVLAMLQLLEPCCQITSIDLSNNPFSAPQTSALIKCLGTMFIEQLTLSGCSLDNEQVCALLVMLADNQTVSSLNLSHNNISRQVVEHIAQFLHCNRSLTSLDLSHNKLRKVDLILNALSGTNQGIITLNLEDNKIGHSSVYSLCKLFQYNYSLTDLNLANNKLREEAGKLSHPPSLCSLLSALCSLLSALSLSLSLSLVNSPFGEK